MSELIFQQPIPALQTLFLALQTLFLALQAIVLLATAAVVVWYTKETCRLRKAAEHQTKCQLDAHTFDAITRVCQLLSSADAIRRRRWLHKYFEKDWEKALQSVEGQPLTTERLDDALQSQSRDCKEGKYDPLENVEGVLADLNVLGISCCLKIEAADRLAKEYEPVIRNTARLLLLFVKKQRELRNEPSYKREYVALLQSLDLLKGPLAQYADMVSVSPDS